MVNSNLKGSNRIQELRDRVAIGKDNILEEDVIFDSLSAACFVAGYSVNGRNAWKTEAGIKLSEYLKEK